MRRRRFLKGITGAAALSVAPSPAWAQKLSAKRIYGITARGKTPVEQGFIDEISRFGLPADIIWRDANQDMTKIPGFVREIQELKPDLVYTWGTPLTLNVAGAYDSVDRSRHVTGIPIVFANVASPVGAKIVASLKGQGRDVTGVFHVAALATQLEAMRAYKTFSKIGFLYDKSQANMVAIASDLRSLARAQGFSLIEQIFDQDVDGKPVGTGAEAKVTKLKQLGAEWLYLGPDTFALSQLGRIAPVAIEVGLPAFGATEAFLKAPTPVLAGLVSSYYAVGQLAGVKAIQILADGIRARDIPIETLARYSFIVQMQVAKALQVLPPVSLFNHAIFR